MKKAIVGVLCGAVAYFVWGMLSWTIIPWHHHVVKTLPEEQLITDTLKTVVTEPGFYIFPSMLKNGQMLDRAAFAERYRKGPTGVVAFSVGGKEFMGPVKYLVAMAAAVGIALITMSLLCLTRDRVKTALSRALLVTSVGAVCFLATHLSHWNWFSFPSDFTAVAAADSLVTFFILGLAQTPFVPKD